MDVGGGWDIIILFLYQLIIHRRTRTPPTTKAHAPMMQQMGERSLSVRRLVMAVSSLMDVFGCGFGCGFVVVVRKGGGGNRGGGGGFVMINFSREVRTPTRMTDNKSYTCNKYHNI